MLHGEAIRCTDLRQFDDVRRRGEGASFHGAVATSCWRGFIAAAEGIAFARSELDTLTVSPWRPCRGLLANYQ